MISSHNTPTIKAVIIGDTGVGKTSILNMFCNKQINLNQETTLGVAFQNKVVLVNDKQINFSVIQLAKQSINKLWDTAGQEQFQAIVSIYYRDANAAIIVYDITSRKSFDRLKVWVNEIDQRGPKNISMLARIQIFQVKVLVGNKVDLIEKEEVKYDEVQTYARQIGATLKLTSAKENEGITELFNSLGQQALYELEQNQKQQEQQNKDNNDNESHNQKVPLKVEQTKTQNKEQCKC